MTLHPNSAARQAGYASDVAAQTLNIGTGILVRNAEQRWSTLARRLSGRKKIFDFFFFIITYGDKHLAVSIIMPNFVVCFDRLLQLNHRKPSIYGRQYQSYKRTKTPPTGY